MVKPREPVPEAVHFATGTVKATGFLLEGVMHGAWEWFRLDGTIMRTGRFARVRQVGVWGTFERSGRLVKGTEFSTRTPA